MSLYFDGSTDEIQHKEEGGVGKLQHEAYLEK